MRDFGKVGEDLLRCNFETSSQTVLMPFLGSMWDIPVEFALAMILPIFAAMEVASSVWSLFIREVFLRRNDLISGVIKEGRGRKL